MTTGGRHEIRMIRASRPAEPLHWQRDTSYDGELAARSVEKVWKALRSDALGTASLLSRWDTSASVDDEAHRNLFEETAPSESGEIDGQLSSTSRSLKDDALDRVRDQLAGHFDPSFLTLDVSPDQFVEGHALLGRGLVAYEAPETVVLRQQITDYEKNIKKNTKTGSEYEERGLAKLQTKLLNVVSKAMVSESYLDLHHARDSKGVNGSDKLFGRPFPRTRSGITTLKRGRSDVLERPPKAEQVAAAGITGIARSEDKQTRVSDHLACDALMILRETPIASRVYGFTACGPVFRLWCYDPLRYSSSLPCDVSPGVTDRQHAIDFCKMVALLCGPLDVLSGHWNPADQARVHMRDDPAGTSQEPGVMEMTDWKPDMNRNGLIFVREQLFGRRTTAFAGKGTINGKEKDLIIKVCYLSEGLRFHEQAVIKRIRDVSLKESLKSAPPDFTFSGQDRLDLQRGRERLPHYVSTLDFSDHPGGTIECYDASTGKTKRYFLSGVVTEGRPGTVLAADTKIEQIVQVYADIVRCLWAAALCGIHYRDLNQGNILLSESGGGLLIDFGHAKLGNSRLLFEGSIQQQVDALQDDARSANPYFICLASMEAGQLADQYLEIEGLLLQELKAASNAAIIALRQRNYNESVQDIANFRHRRYCSDIESLLYCLIHQIGRRAPDTNPLDKLKNHLDKQTEWEAGFKATLGRLGVTTLGALGVSPFFEMAFRKAVDNVKTMEHGLKQGYPSNSAVPNKPVQIEHICFRQSLRAIMDLDPPATVASVITRAESTYGQEKAAHGVSTGRNE